MTPPVMLITGTSRGIGRGMAEHFVQMGYQVAGCSRGPDTLQINGYQHHQVDISDAAQVRAWVRSVKTAYRRIDALVCNAAAVPPPSLLPMTAPAMVESVLKTNVAGTYYVCQEVAKVMMIQKAGRIVGISSMAAAFHDEGTSLYAASKSAVAELSKVLARELAPLGVTCNVVAPSILETDAVEVLGEPGVARALERLSIKRFLTIEEVCHAVSFFLSPLAGPITGQVLYMGLVN